MVLNGSLTYTDIEKETDNYVTDEIVRNIFYVNADEKALIHYFITAMILLAKFNVLIILKHHFGKKRIEKLFNIFFFLIGNHLSFCRQILISFVPL